MPELSRFLGIVIYMYYREHAPPHFHAEYAEFEITVEIATGAGFLADPVQDFFLQRYADAYREELAAFLSHIRSGTPPAPSGRDGLLAQRLADAATASWQAGTPVRV